MSQLMGAVPKKGRFVMPIVKFVIEHCSKEVIGDIKRLMEEEKSLFAVTSTPGLKKVHDIIYQNATVISVHPRLKTANLILLHISLQVDSEGCFGFDGYDDWCRVTSELTLDYYLSFDKSGGYDFLFVEARAGVTDNYDETNSLRQDLIPYISSARYDEEAECFCVMFVQKLLRPQCPLMLLMWQQG